MISAWSGGRPSTIDDLFKFYHEYVKLLYSYVQTQDTLPQETLFEINAAFDHLSRHWTIGESAEDACSKAYGHLKRSCLDVFKIKLRETRNQYDELGLIDTSSIDNGDYDRDLHLAFNKIRHDATEARRVEGQKDDNDAVPAFELWEDVFIQCLDFEKKYFLHDRLDWAKRRKLLQALKHMWTGVAIAVVAWAIRVALADFESMSVGLIIVSIVMLLSSSAWHAFDAGYFRKIKSLFRPKTPT